MRQWIQEERERQGQLIKKWKPWKTGGVKTPEGKARSAKNSIKHGLYSEETNAMRRYLRHCHNFLRELGISQNH